MAFDLVNDPRHTGNSRLRWIPRNLSEPPFRDDGVNLSQLGPSCYRRLLRLRLGSSIAEVEILLNDLLIVVDENPESLPFFAAILTIKSWISFDGSLHKGGC